MNTDKCAKQVQAGSYTYAARNSTRQCGNKATATGFCAKHAPIVTTAEEREAFAELRAKLGL